MIANSTFRKVCLILKAYSAISVVLDRSGIFILSPVGFPVSPVESLLLSLTPKHFLKMRHFFRWAEQSPPRCWDRVQRCIRLLGMLLRNHGCIYSYYKKLSNQLVTKFTNAFQTPKMHIYVFFYKLSKIAVTFQNQPLATSKNHV